ncbi:MAG: hypothetical protein ACJAUW_000206 [Yoonia sp.]
MIWTKKIESALPYAFILQRVAPGTVRFRAAGQRIFNLLKVDARGMPLSTLFHPDTRNPLGDLLENAFCEPAILGLPLVSPSTVLRPAMHGAMILLRCKMTKDRQTGCWARLSRQIHRYHAPAALKSTANSRSGARPWVQS